MFVHGERNATVVEPADVLVIERGRAERFEYGVADRGGRLVLPGIRHRLRDIAVGLLIRIPYGGLRRLLWRLHLPPSGDAVQGLAQRSNARINRFR